MKYKPSPCASSGNRGKTSGKYSRCGSKPSACFDVWDSTCVGNMACHANIPSRLEIEAERLLAIDPITLILRERVSSENTSPLLSVRPRSGLASRPLLLRGEDFGLNAGRSPEYDRETVRSCWFPLSGFMQRSRHRSLRTGASASQARLPGHNHTHKPCFRNANVEEDFRGSAWILSLEPELLCPDFRDLAQESQAHQPRPQMPMRRPRFPTIEASLPDSSLALPQLERPKGGRTESQLLGQWRDGSYRKDRFARR